MRNCSLQAICPFPPVFRKLVLQTRKNQGLFGKGLTNAFSLFFTEHGLLILYCNKSTSKSIVQVKFEEKTEYMNIDLRQTVKDFKKLLQNFTGLPPSKMRVSYVENFDGWYKDIITLRLPNKTLLSLNINEGDEFQIDRV